MRAHVHSSRLSLALAALSLTTAACTLTIIRGGDSGDGGGSVTTTLTPTTITTWSEASGSTYPPTYCTDATPVGVPPSPCTPNDPSCGAHVSRCLAMHNAHGAPEFTLRVAHITLSAPQALKQGIVKSVFDGSTAPQQEACGLHGDGGFNWLLSFDMASGTLTTGGAKPTTNPSAGYAFVNETLTLGGASFSVSPVVLAAPIGPTCGVSSSAGDVLLPFFDGTSSTTFTLFPLRSLRFKATAVTPDHDCIGSYDPTGLDPNNACLPDDAHPAFIDGGAFSAFIALEDADVIEVPVLNESLCVLLSGDSTSYGQNGRCKRDANDNIVLQGDWCSATNQPATPGCADALRFEGSFAASGVAMQ